MMPAIANEPFKFSEKAALRIYASITVPGSTGSASIGPLTGRR
jgi:hypothetical protein